MGRGGAAREQTGRGTRERTLPGLVDALKDAAAERVCAEKEDAVWWPDRRREPAGGEGGGAG